jgi:transposase-like protein
MKTEKPNCPKCKKPMRLVSTGAYVRTFYCSECNQTKIVNREDVKKT